MATLQRLPRTNLCSAVTVVLCLSFTATAGAEETTPQKEAELPAPEKAGDLLEKKVKVGLADCPITRLRRFKNHAKSWGEATDKARNGEPSVTWLPFDIIRAFDRELTTMVLPMSGVNSRALFYFALPEKTSLETRGPSSRALVKFSQDPDMNQRLSFFFDNRGNPAYQLTTVPGALDGSEKEFLYANLGRLSYRSSCLTTAQAALSANVGLPLGEVAKTLDIASRNSRSTLMFYGTFQSPLWFMLSGDRGMAAEAEALLGIWDLYRNSPNGGPARSYVTNFTGWLLLYVQGREIEGSASLNARGSATLGIASLQASAGARLSGDEAVAIESYELLIETQTMQFGDLPKLQDVKSRWDNSPYATSSLRVLLDGSRNGKGILQIPGISEDFCSRFTSSTVLYKTYDSKRTQLPIGAQVDVGTAALRDGVCSIQVSLEKVPKEAETVLLWLSPGKKYGVEGKPLYLENLVTVTW